MENVRDKVVVITGASSGIGASTASLLAEQGAKVVLSARRKDRMDALADSIRSKGGEALVEEGDVVDADRMKALAEAAKKTYGRLDVWINNAGLMPLSPIAALRTDDWNRMVDVNIKGVLNGIAACHPIMQEQGSGHIINVSSVAGHKVFPTAAVYCATKFAVTALSEGLRMESGGKIRVTNVSPGAIATELADHIPLQEIKDAFADVLEQAIPAEAIARAIVYAIGEPEDVDVNELIIRPASQEL